MKRLEGRLDNQIDAALNDLNNRLEIVEDVVTTLNTRVGNLEAEVGRFDRRINNRLNTMTPRIDRLSDSIDGLRVIIQDVRFLRQFRSGRRRQQNDI